MESSTYESPDIERTSYRFSIKSAPHWREGKILAQILHSLRVKAYRKMPIACFQPIRILVDASLSSGLRLGWIGSNLRAEKMQCVFKHSVIIDGPELVALVCSRPRNSSTAVVQPVKTEECLVMAHWLQPLHFKYRTRSNKDDPCMR